MIVFPSHMKPTALINNDSQPLSFTCDICGAKENGLKVQPKKGKKNELWAILPEDWAEIEDVRQNVKKQFVICCSGSDCQRAASANSGR